jgi:hypothetical protein
MYKMKDEQNNTCNKVASISPQLYQKKKIYQNSLTWHSEWKYHYKVKTLR